MSGAEVLALIGLGLAAPDVIDVLVRVGKSIATKAADTLKESKNAKEYASNLQIFLVPAGIERVELQMRRAQNILKDRTVDDMDKDRLNSIFDAIKSTLKHMDDLAAIVLKAGGAFSRKRRAALAALKEETKRFKDFFDDFRERISALRDLAASESDLFLAGHQFQWIASDDASNNPLDDQPESLGLNVFLREGKVTQQVRGVKPEWRTFLYERIFFNARNKSVIKENVEIIAKKLDAAEKTESGILPILGYREDMQEDEFQLIFIMPKDDRLSRSLNRILQDQMPMPSLNYRVQICLQLAESLLHVHSVRLVHKSIRPGNIVVSSAIHELQRLQSADDGKHRVKVALMGWQNARTTEAYDTQRAGEQLWQRRIYQHPQRQKRVADADYNIGHDIYSLGACMLEILRWEPFVIQRDSGTGTPVPQLSQSYVEEFERLKLGEKQGVRAASSSDVEWLMQEPKHVQEVLLSLSHKELPRLVGHRLANLVRDCLTRLDSKSDPTEDVPIDSSDRKEVGSDFVDRVLKHILAISNTV